MKMKAIACLFALQSLAAGLSHATVDGWATVSIVREDFNAGKYEVIKAPYLGCWGIACFTTLQAMTAKHMVPDVGCGNEQRQADMNALSCAQMSGTENETFDGLATLSVELSNCKTEMTQDKSFQKALKKAIIANFPELKEGYDSKVDISY